jgi:hypothetical protein
MLLACGGKFLRGLTHSFSHILSLALPVTVILLRRWIAWIWRCNESLARFSTKDHHDYSPSWKCPLVKVFLLRVSRITHPLA